MSHVLRVHILNAGLQYDDEDETDLPSVCECPQPNLVAVVLFGWLELTDVHECARCGRPPPTEIRRH